MQPSHKPSNYSPAPGKLSSRPAANLFTRSYLLFSLLLIPLIAWSSLSGRQGPMIELYDYWEHTASIKELASNLLNPSNPFLDLDGSTTLRYTPYIFSLAFIIKLSGCDLSTMLTLISILNFIFLAIGVNLFCKEYFHDSKQPLYTLFTLLFLWGSPFNYSNEYNLRFFSYTSFYPSVVTFSLSFIGFYFFLRFSRDHRLSDYWLYLLFAIFIFTTHPLTGSFFLLGILLLALTEGEKKITTSTFFLVSLFAVIFVTFLWPYYPFLKALQKAVTTPWAQETRVYLYQTRNIYKMGAAVLGLPVIALMILKRKYHFISYGFILCAFIYIVTYKPNIYLGERYIFFSIVFLHLALSWYLRKLQLLSLRTLKETLINLTEKNLHIPVLVVILIMSFFYQLSKLSFEQIGYTINYRPRPIVEKYDNPVEPYKTLIGKIKQGDLVASDPLTSWLLPTLTGAKIAALYHDNPLVPDNEKRVEAMETLYDETTPFEKRKLILVAYNVTHVLLNFDRMQDCITNRINDYYKNYKITNRLIDDLNKLGHPIVKNEHFILYEVNVIS